MKSIDEILQEILDANSDKDASESSLKLICTCTHIKKYHDKDGACRYSQYCNCYKFVKRENQFRRRRVAPCPYCNTMIESHKRCNVCDSASAILRSKYKREWDGIVKELQEKQKEKNEK